MGVQSKDLLPLPHSSQTPSHTYMYTMPLNVWIQTTCAADVFADLFCVSRKLICLLPGHHPQVKTPDPDFLGLRPKPNVTCLAFVDPGDERKVLIGHPGQVGTEHHTVMLYDTSVGPRPVQKMNFGEVCHTTQAKELRVRTEQLGKDGVLNTKDKTLPRCRCTFR
jgi:hypothetical protein